MKRSRSISSISPYQYFMGVVFTSMGLATMLLPEKVLDHSLSREFLDLPANAVGSLAKYPKSLILMVQCFGSQASLCGLLILTSKFRKSTFKYFGFAMIPYFIFDYYFWHTKALTTFGAVGDGVGNVIFSVCSILGYRQAIADDEDDE
jgi:hypothetical protein